MLSRRSVLSVLATALVAILPGPLVTGIVSAATTEPLHKPNRRAVYLTLETGSSVCVTEASGRTVIVGETAPNRRGYISNAPRTDLDWFARDSSPGYLAEKFLRKEWSAAQAKIDIVCEYTDRLEEPEIRDILDALEHAQDEDQAMIASIIDAFDTSDGVPGERYRPDEVGWLASVHLAYRAHRLRGGL